QYFAYFPLQMSLFFRKPLETSTFQFAFVIAWGAISSAGSLLRPLVVTNPVVGGFLPFRIATAAFAVLVASFRTSFHTVIVCQPEMMFWTPCEVASWPLIGIGFR